MGKELIQPLQRSGGVREAVDGKRRHEQRVAQCVEHWNNREANNRIDNVARLPEGQQREQGAQHGHTKHHHEVDRVGYEVISEQLELSLANVAYALVEGLLPCVKLDQLNGGQDLGHDVDALRGGHRVLEAHFGLEAAQIDLQRYQ